MKRRIQYFGSIAAVKKQSLFLGTTAIILGAAVISSVAMPVSALDYQKTINVGFTVNDTITIIPPASDLVISDLAPGSAADSNIISVKVLSNNPYGYTLTSTVGNETTYNNRNLTNTTAASSTPFASLAHDSSVASLTEFTDNTWGYSYSDQTMATPTWTNYSGLPLYNDATNIATLKESSTTSSAAGDEIKFKVGAKASDTQLAGEYKNVVNFILTGAPTPPSKIYMQSMTADQCVTDSPTTVYDSRDEEEYKVQRLADGKCWMLDNLRLNPATATLNTSNTNMNASVTPTYTNTTSSFTSYTAAQFNASYKDNTTTSYGSGSGKVGVYYNFCAASAGTICTDSNTSDASYDICPAGWRMPTGGSSGEYQALYTVYSSNATNFRNALSTPLSGYFYDSSQSRLGSYGYSWSSTRINNTNMYSLSVSSSDVYPQYFNDRYSGRSIRCVAK